jgi:predicted DNA-binding transcriptional regulator AlpA
LGDTAAVTNHLVGVSEIAEMLGVSRQRVDQISKADPRFPKPEVVLKGGKVWSREAIERWIASQR